MADDIADEEATEAVANKGGRTIPQLLGGVAVLLALGGFASGYALGMNSALVAVLNAGDDEALDGKLGADGAPGENGELQGNRGEPEGEAVFLTLRPDFTANFSAGEEMRFMQVGLDVMARDEAILQQIEALMPKVRYEILRILGRQDASIYTSEGKDALLAEIRTKLQKLVVTEAGTVEDVFYTSFLIQ